MDSDFGLFIIITISTTSICLLGRMDNSCYTILFIHIIDIFPTLSLRTFGHVSVTGFDDEERRVLLHCYVLLHVITIEGSPELL